MTLIHFWFVFFILPGGQIVKGKSVVTGVFGLDALKELGASRLTGRSSFDHSHCSHSHSVQDFVFESDTDLQSGWVIFTSVTLLWVLLHFIL